MAAELARRPVALILANAPPAALTAKATTATIPIVFVVGLDPVAAGLVASLGQPGGNATGMTLISIVLGQKRLEILREVAPKVTVVAMLANRISPDAVPEIGTVQAAARAMGVELAMFNVSTVSEFAATFAAIAERRPDAVLVGTDPLFVNQRDEIVARANTLRLAHDLSLSRIRGIRWANQLRIKHSQCLPAGWHLCWPDPQRRKTR
jgi:putative ABC transport system substrate-binding protein